MFEEKKHPELVFGLVGPIGVNMDDVESKLCASLQTVGYEPISIRATEIMQQVDVGIEIKHSADPLTHYQTRIDYANAVRRKCNNDAAIAGLVMLHIRQLRYDINSQILSNKELESENASEIPLQKHAFVIRQFKRKEEIDALKKVYGSKFIQLSANARQEERLKGLSRRMASQNPNLDKDTCDKYAEQLIERDLNEITVNWGQRIGDVFHLGDVFVDANTEVLIEKNIRRFVEAFFGRNSISPSADEYGTYMAASASLRSIDTARQVGASIFTTESEVVALGCNEVPKAGGGTYWSDDIDPHRDYDEGHDANTTYKRRLLFDIIKRLRDNEFINSPSSDIDLFQEIIGNENISDSLLMDITEFGRMTHAEMNAITDAARLGRSLKGATLYCTTFPCHNCAKHIIASGIQRVVFIEPYPKSKASELHEDSISFGRNRSTNKVSFEHFYGISPRRYRDIFEKKRRRKGDGTLEEWYEKEAAPRIEDRSSFHTFNETSAIFSILEKVAEDFNLTE